MDGVMTTTDRERAAERALEEESKDADKPAEVDPHEDRTKETKTPGFSRMRMDWHSPEGAIMGSINEVVESRIMVNFAECYQIMNDLYDLVRTPLVNEHGEIQYDKWGWPLWAKHESGRYIEDYSALGHKERDTFLMQITTRLFDWEQQAADAWGEAMFSKAIWEEKFALSFVEPKGRTTDETKTQQARIGARDERYFAIFQSLYSRKADALVRSMERLSQRLKDTLA